MANGSNKTSPTNGDVGAFIDTVADDQRRHDARLLLTMMQEVTAQPPVMWGASIVGFGSRHYRYTSGRAGDVPAVSFSPRKAQAVLYLTGGLDQYEDLLARLGQYQTGKGCLYLKRVDQADAATLREVIDRSYRLGTSS